MKRIKKTIANNSHLLKFIGLSYFDKMIIFLLPIAVLTFFKEKSVYVNIEYIYSIVIVFIPFLDLGISGYFFYAYRNSKNKKQTVSEIFKIFHLLYLILFSIGALLIFFHYFIIPFEKNIIYIVARSVFVLSFTFFTSYYRLINKPQNALYITLSANIISLAILFIYLFFNLKFELWLLFLGQILFCVFFFIKIIIRVIIKWKKCYQYISIVNWFRKSILFSWPNMIQVFILMYVANYGKINAINNLTVDQAVLLSLTQRFSMLIQLTHAAILGYLMKDLFISSNLYVINKNLLLKYLALLLTSVVMVVIIIVGYLMFFGNTYNLSDLLLNISLIIGYTFTWCIYSYFELYYSRENKNIFKMYLALINGIVFFMTFHLLTYNYLERITFAMFASMLFTLLTSIIILKKRKYQLV